VTASVVVDDVAKRYRLFHERNQSVKAALMRRRRVEFQEFWALDGVSFEVPQGTTFGLIGENGSGKSTLLKCMARILRPDRGHITTTGKVSALLELGAGFHPELSGRDNVYLNASILGLPKREVDRRFDEIVSFAGLEERIDTPVKNYSSGMYIRLGFSVAINVDPDLLLIDEVLTVGDEAFQRKCAEKFMDLKESGKTIVIVSHALGMVRDLCDQVALLEHGKLVEVGAAADVIDEYLGGVERNVRPDGEHGMRFGDGGATIDGVEILGADARPLTTVRSGHPVTFRVHWSAEQPIDKPVWRLELLTGFGVVIGAANTRYHHQVPDVVQGSGYVDYTIPSLTLVPGIYDLSATFFDFDCRNPFDVRHRFIRFHVEPGLLNDIDGQVSLGGLWTGPDLPPGPVA
jgi:ABC-2 type transport system ATP-binding protein